MAEQAETLDGPLLQRLRNAAAVHSIVVSLGLALRLPEDGRVINSVTHISADGEVLGDPRCSGKGMYTYPLSCTRWHLSLPTACVSALAITDQLSRDVCTVHVCPGVEQEMFAQPRPHEAFPVVDLGFARVGSVVCYDAEFPESSRELALGGADVIFMCFATGRMDSTGRRAASPADWSTDVQRYAPGIAYSNRVFVVGCNHAGNIVDDLGVATMAE